MQTICVSLEGLLKERVYDARACAVVASHIDALVLLSSQRKPDSGAVKLLIEELEQCPHSAAPGTGRFVEERCKAILTQPVRKFPVKAAKSARKILLAGVALRL